MVGGTANAGNQSTCLICHVPLLPGVRFCSQCGKAVT
jgi:hypothetical protein